ncbi:MAG TPA: circadian clock protein KaiC [Terriglobales bacterium]|nr:circadian clock protein KaiC [Terriglobales bacterium]
MATKRLVKEMVGIGKEPTGIAGLDEVLFGGVPKGRNTLVVGGPGAGKTMLGLEFLLHGARDYGEPGVCMSFEEPAEQLIANSTSVGHNLRSLISSRKLLIDHVYIERKEIEETGEYDLEGLFIRLNQAIQRVNAKRVLLDTVEVLFAGLQNTATLRAELRRLFRWLTEKGMTTIITAETQPGTNSLTRYGLEEYVADCVIILDHRVNEQVSTRRLRVMKYRGSPHGTNEYPFLMESSGISVVPITSLGLTHKAGTERISSGVSGLDEMLGGRGFYRGSSVLISGTAGTGKSSFASFFANAACARGERCLYFAYEESPSQILRNMRSVGLDLEQWIKKGLLRIYAARPTSTGLEGHLAIIHKALTEFDPSVVVMDPITNLVSVGNLPAVKAMLTRLIDFLKLRDVTAVFTNLTLEGMVEKTAIGISSLMDSWVLLRDIETDADRRRMLYLLKSRGMAHSTKTVEFQLSDRGITLRGEKAGVVSLEKGRK